MDSLGGNAKHGQGQFVIAEADESDGSFLHLPATYGIVTNVDNDHLDHFGNLAAIEDAFVDFVGESSPFYRRLAAVCGEDAGVRRVPGSFHEARRGLRIFREGFRLLRDRIVQSTGIGSELRPCIQRAVGRLVDGSRSSRCPGAAQRPERARRRSPSRSQLRIPFGTIARGLSEFKGVKRRFEIKYQDAVRVRAIIDDYGHHPTEVAADHRRGPDLLEGQDPDRLSSASLFTHAALP